MDEKKFVDNKLKLYEDTFDFYMDCGSMPDSLPEGDVLTDYMQSVFNDNPQLDSQDKLWADVLHDHLMSFLHELLNAFIPIEKFCEQDRKMNNDFQLGDIDTKRQMWPEVTSHIRANFSKDEINLDGFINQFNGENSETVLDALTEEWKKANENKRKEKERNIVINNQKQFEQRVMNYGLTDYKEKKAIKNIYYQYPALKEIVQLMGRSQKTMKNEILDDIVVKYVPVLPQRPMPVAEREEISIGNDLNYVIPIETTYISDAQTELLFYQKFAAHQLQLYSNKPPMVSQLKKEMEQITKPRLEKGPIIVSIDTSLSMSGKPEEIANSLLRELLQMAKTEKRKCFLLSFSVESKSIELTNSHNWRQLDEFLKNRFTGGTNGEEMLNEALNKLDSGDFEMADVLIISDFLFPVPVKWTMNRIGNAHHRGTRFYGLCINGDEKQYSNVLDKIWKI